jgi:hypothetical protein
MSAKNCSFFKLDSAYPAYTLEKNGWKNEIRARYCLSNFTQSRICYVVLCYSIGLFGKAKIRLSEIWQRMRFVVVFRLQGKGHKKFNCLQ